MNYTIATKCRSCGSTNLKDIISLGEQKIVEFTNKPVSVPLEVIQCKDCKLVQLRHTTNANLLWNEGYGYRSGVNDAMVKHLHGIAHQAEQFLNFGDRVLDIGCNDGTLLNGYEKNVLLVGIDPSKNVASYAHQTLVGKEHRIVYDFFSKERLNQTFNVITAISMFYDLDDPNKFIEDIVECLDYNGVFIVQQNYLGSMIRNCAFDNICHEHLEYYSLTALENLLGRHGLEVFRVEENDLNGGSIRTFIARKGEREIEDSVPALLTKELKMKLSRFSEKYKKITKKIHDLVCRLHDEGQTIYVYGASTRGGTLLQACGIDHNQIQFAVERNPDKFGKIMECTGIPIISEEQARLDEPDYMIILPWFFAKHFIEREKEYIEEGGAFIIPLPNLKVVR
jgi:SAM-dependent methyltransferase